MFWKKVILLLMVPVMLLSLGHICVDTHAEHHDDHICAHETHEHHCNGCDTEVPEKTVPSRDTTVPQLSQLRLLATFILLDRAPDPQAIKPRPVCVQLEHRNKLASRQRLLSVQFLI